jgi:hypothetical protein
VVTNVEISVIFGNDIGNQNHPRKEDQDGRFVEKESLIIHPSLF